MRSCVQLAEILESIVATCDVPARLALDPVGVVRTYRHPAQQELAGLLSASLAFGQVKALRRAIEQVLSRMGSDWMGVLEDRHETLCRLEGFQYRMVRGRDIGRLLVGARFVQRRQGSLGEAFCKEFHLAGALRPALVAWTRQLRDAAGAFDHEDQGRRGYGHVLPDPAGASPNKRLLLFLRWMVRPNDGVDLGLWTTVPPSALLIPVDTHIHRLGKLLGMTQRSNPSWLAAEDITAVLRQIDPDDPVRFDFALCHLGMTLGCSTRPDPTRCESCPVRADCQQRAQPRMAESL
ncbi:MAG TPA: TIGR02757 family protein [Polyangiaceae bacterium]|jgi:uncharacterized protein (TIGR02757 family)|nr:MAG: Endonuclease III [Deltaproteobacteria bacterium ADurb.Bin207]HNT00350.1 TIGR02757 family protein [Polyangiaceae bacterium]HNZ25269.1 TIGR02757 family protein [Polyangiaceae bacterium]HOD23124.1 TIGR02757 family protein [Polyangiaceae bacterium]HOE50863.1 TIGR02757 family protein [Polyangiaceae bacterium]